MHFIRIISLLIVILIYSIKLFSISDPLYHRNQQGKPYDLPLFTSLVQNNFDGMELIFSNHQAYLIAPWDQEITSAWLAPIDVKIELNDNLHYPWLITNLASLDTVEAQLSPSSR